VNALAGEVTAVTDYMTYATESYRDMANSGLFVIAAISGTSSDSCHSDGESLIL